MKKRFSLKYPKLISLVIVVILAYVLFKYTDIGKFISNLSKFNYGGVFIAGMLYTFGFTSPFSAGFFLMFKPGNIFLVGLIGGVGAMISDLLIFRFVKISFAEEFRKLKKEKALRKIGKIMKILINKKIRKLLLYLFAGILIASPLPDEAGITILAGLSQIKQKIIVGVSFILNTIGIILLLMIGR